MKRLQEWARIATDRSVVRRALVTCGIVGVILVAINHGDALLRGELDAGRALAIALTVLVPYLVATVSSVAAIVGRRSGDTREYQLLEREIEAINRFPGQNPNPVLRVAAEGRLLYANASSEPITSALGVAVGDRLAPDLLAELQRAAADSPPRSIELRSGQRTFAVLPVAVPEFDVVNLYGTDITARKVIDKFPDQNPNPVLRMTDDGRLLYANAASARLTGALGLRLGDTFPPDLLGRLRRAREEAASPLAPAEPVEVVAGAQTYALRPVAISEFGFTNIYGTDITAMKAITKFPDQNPNPVFRLSPDGRLAYANRTSALITKALGAEVGDRVPADFFDRVQAFLAAAASPAAASTAAPPDPIELSADRRLFALLPVWVPEFDFINVYGTDITAAREVERLLLNILPAPIAQRLRQGEMVIADQFDEMTVLFADVVDFTKLASRLSPTEVVDVLNGVFSIFDRLADRYGLEKIKTIGDAYMVVGGLTPEHADHAERVADMGLDMIGEVARFRNGHARDLEIRAGMHVGPAVAGVIGIKKFIYDVWGDTVNTASRMESHGVPGRLQVTESTYERLKDAFRFEPRGTVEVKGKGPTSTYLLVERIPVEADTAAAAPARPRSLPAAPPTPLGDKSSR